MVAQGADHVGMVSAAVQPDFTLAASPTYFYPYSVPYNYPDMTWTGNITATSIGGFAGTVNYTWTVNPAVGLDRLSVSPFIVDLGAGQSFLSALIISWSPRYAFLPQDNNWTVTIAATSGALRHSINVTAIDGGIQLKDLGSKSSMFPGGGVFLEANVSVSAENFVGGVVQLGAGVPTYNDGYECKQFSNNVAPGLSTTLSKYSIQLTRNESANTTLTVLTNSSAAPGTYRVNIWASGPPGVPIFGGIGYDVTIPGLVISNSVLSGGSPCESGMQLTIPTGGQGTTLIFIRGGCLDTTLTALSVPTGMNVTIAPSIVRSGQSTLTVTVSSTVQPGNYSILIGGTSCSQAARTVVPLTVTNPNGPGTFYWILGSLVAGVAAAISLGIVAKRRGWIAIRHKADAGPTTGSKIPNSELSFEIVLEV